MLKCSVENSNKILLTLKATRLRQDKTTTFLTFSLPHRIFHTFFCISFYYTCNVWGNFREISHFPKIQSILSSINPFDGNFDAYKNKCYILRQFVHQLFKFSQFHTEYENGRWSGRIVNWIWCFSVAFDT